MSQDPVPPRLADETRWYTEHTALLISTLKWALLGAVAGVCVGGGTRIFLWTLDRSADWARLVTFGRFPADYALPLALPHCVWIIRAFASDARGHGTEAVIAAVHQRAGRIDWLIAPVYASQKIGLSKSAGLDVELGGAIGDVGRGSVRIRKGSFTDQLHQKLR